MSATSKLAQALQEAGEKLPRGWSLFDRGGLPQTFDVLDPIMRELVALVPQLRDQDTYLHVGLGGGNDAEVVLARAALSKTPALGPDAAASWMLDLARGGPADLVLYCLLAGVTVPAPLGLSDKMELRPRASLAKFRLRPLTPPLGPSPDALINAMGVRADTLLVAAAGEYPVVRTGPPRPPLGVLQALDAALEATHLLAIVGPCSPTLVNTWFGFADEELEAARASFGSGGPGLEIVPPRGPGLTLDDKLIEPVRLALECPPPLRRRLALAGERLSFALRRRKHQDRAVETAIALEALLSDGKDELSYRYSLRAALFLRDRPEDREAVRNNLKRLYEVRSKVVHGTHVVLDAYRCQQIDESVTLCAELAREIALRRGMPNWKNLEVGLPP